jgi:hypothetical protein
MTLLISNATAGQPPLVQMQQPESGFAFTPHPSFSYRTAVLGSSKEIKAHVKQGLDKGWFVTAIATTTAPDGLRITVVTYAKPR